MKDAKQIEAFLAAFGAYRCANATPSHSKIVEVEDFRDGRYESKKTDFLTFAADVVRATAEIHPEALSLQRYVLRENIAKHTGKMRLHGKNYGLTVLPVFEPPIADEQQQLDVSIQGVEINDSIYAADTEHSFVLYFKTPPHIAMKEMPQFYHDKNHEKIIVGANHPLGPGRAHISSRIKPNALVSEATFVHNGFEEYKFFIQHNGGYMLGSPITVPKASLHQEKDIGSLQELLEMLRP